MSEEGRDRSVSSARTTHRLSVSGSSPEIMGVGPIEASRKVLKQAGMSIDDVETMELNEAFAAQVLPVCREVGSTVLGQAHPTAGRCARPPLRDDRARIMNTLLNDLETRDQTWLETMWRRWRTGDGDDRGRLA